MNQELPAKYKEFHNLSDELKITPRIWNSKINYRHALKYLTWTLNININVIGFKRSRNFFECNHDVVNNCHFPFYIFQNTLVKVLRHSHPLSSINIFKLNNKYYLYKETNIYPFLINIYPLQSVVFENKLITNNDVINILHSEPVNFPFNIKVYTSYSYLRHTWTKQIQFNIIGEFLCNNEITLHLFLTPHLNNGNFNLNIIENISTNINLKKQNIFSNSNLTEGNKIYHSKIESNKEPLNQENCICDHSDTKRVYLPKTSSFKSLGKKDSLWSKFIMFNNFNFNLKLGVWRRIFSMST